MQSDDLVEVVKAVIFGKLGDFAHPNLRAAIAEELARAVIPIVRNQTIKDATRAFEKAAADGCGYDGMLDAILELETGP